MDARVAAQQRPSTAIILVASSKRAERRHDHHPGCVTPGVPFGKGRGEKRLACLVQHRFCNCPGTEATDDYEEPGRQGENSISYLYPIRASFRGTPVCSLSKHLRISHHIIEHTLCLGASTLPRLHASHHTR